ncbi:hypothetical protein RQP46_004222 [Phenoliferia psychrophenolica]
MDLGWIPSDDLYRDDSNPTVVFEVADLREVDMAKVGRLLGPGFDVKLVLILDIVRHSPSSPHFKLSFHQYFLHAQTTTLLHHPHANFTYDSENPTDLPKVELSIDALLGTNLPGALLEYDVTRQITSLPSLISTFRSQILLHPDRSDPSSIRLLVDSRACGGRDEIEDALKSDDLWGSKSTKVEWEDWEQLVLSRGKAGTNGLVPVCDDETGEYRVMDFGWIRSEDLCREDSNPTVVFEVADLRRVDMAKVGRLLGPGFNINLVLILNIIRKGAGSPHFVMTFRQYFHYNHTATLLHHPHATFSYNSETPTDLPKVELSIDALLGTNLPGALLEYDAKRQVTLTL